MASTTIQFIHDGEHGRVTVSCVPSDDPLAIGKPREAAGFPVCSATVAFAGAGYRAFFGWVQMVRSTDNTTGGREFEMDPLGIFRDVPSPYCFFGLTPTLFDAPSRKSKDPIEWAAHSFLAVTPSDHRVLPLLGFGWSFRIDDAGQISIAPVTALPDSAWNAHLPLLEHSYPGWTFERASGLRV